MYNKMINGKIYDPNDSYLLEKSSKCHKLCLEYNNTYQEDVKKRNNILKELIPQLGKNVYLQGPIYFDYGINIQIGDNTYANFNLTILDVCPVIIGSNVFFGPNVSIVTPLHPLRYQDRNIYYDTDKGYYTDKEYGKSIEIGDNCWIASNVTICPGVKIGNGCVIGAGSVVTKDIKSNMLAYGNPCREIREINEKDKIELKKELF